MLCYIWPAAVLNLPSDETRRCRSRGVPCCAACCAAPRRTFSKPEDTRRAALPKRTPLFAVKPENVLLFRSQYLEPGSQQAAAPPSVSPPAAAAAALAHPATSPGASEEFPSSSAGQSTWEQRPSLGTISPQHTSGGGSPSAAGNVSLGSAGSAPGAAGHPAPAAAAATAAAAAASVEAQHEREQRAFLSAIHSVAPLHSDVPPGVSDAVDLMHAHVAKLCDFGCAVVGEPGKPLLGVSGKGSVLYAAPEVFLPYIHVRDVDLAHALWPPKGAPRSILEGGYDACRADVWSFGVSLLVLATGKIPFRAASAISKTFRSFVRVTQPHVLVEEDPLVAPSAPHWASPAASLSPTSRGGAGSPPPGPSQGGGETAWSWPRGFSPALIHLLRGCLAVRPSERFTMEQVTSHPWFGDPSWSPPEQAVQALAGVQPAAATPSHDASPAINCTELFSAASKASGRAQSGGGLAAADTPPAPRSSTQGSVSSVTAAPPRQSGGSSSSGGDSCSGATVLSAVAEAVAPGGGTSTTGSTCPSSGGTGGVSQRSGRGRPSLAPLQVETASGSPASQATAVRVAPLDMDSPPMLPPRRRSSAGRGVHMAPLPEGDTTVSSGRIGERSTGLGVSLGRGSFGTQYAPPVLGADVRQRGAAVSVQGPLLSPGPSGGAPPKPLATPLPRLGLGSVTSIQQGGPSDSARGPLAPRQGTVFSFVGEDTTDTARNTARGRARLDSQASASASSVSHGGSSVAFLVPVSTALPPRGTVPTRLVPLQVPLDQDDSEKGAGHTHTSISDCTPPQASLSPEVGCDGGDSKLAEHAVERRGGSDMPPHTPSARSGPSDVSAVENPSQEVSQ